MNDNILLQTNKNARGDLYIAEVAKHIPFDIKRFYVIMNVPPGEARGTHAHKHTEQALFCLKGSFELLTDDGTGKKKQKLDDPAKGASLPSRIWHSLYNFSEGSIALVVSSEPYDESDYIRDYRDFLEYVK